MLFTAGKCDCGPELLKNAEEHYSLLINDL